MLSSTLFNYAIDRITFHALAGFQGVIVGQNFKLSDLDCADDIVILGENFADVQSAIDEI